MKIKGVLFYTCLCALISSSVQIGGRLSHHPFFQSRSGASPNASTSDKNSASSRTYYTDPFLLNMINRPSYLSSLNDRSQNTNNNQQTNNNPQTTAASTTTTTSTTPSTTTRRNNNIVNPDGTINRNRPGLLVYPTRPQEQNRDRDSQLQAADLWLYQNFGRPSFLQDYRNRYRSNNGNTPTSTPPTQRPQGNQGSPGAVTIDERGTVFINRGNEPPVEDKPFTYADPSIFGTTPHMPNPTTTTRKPNVIGYQGGFNSNIMYAISSALKNGDLKTARSFIQSRRRRASGGQPRFSLYPSYGGDDNVKGAGTHEFMAEGISCYNPSNFSACQYYPSCFKSLRKSCASRGSFIGDDVLRWCGKTINVIESTESDLLKKYLKGVDECVDYKLSEVLEYPSCYDVTFKLGESLLEKNQSSCLFQHGVFCQILEESIARFTLAEMFSKPIQDVDLKFMMRLLVSLGDMTSYCRGPGANIFVTDLMTKVVTSDSPFDIPDPPIPGLSQG